MLTFWKSRFEEINNQNIKANEDYQNDLKKYEDKKDKLIKKYEQLELDWKKQEMLFYEDQDKHNKKIDKMKTSYLNHDPETVIEYCELVLNNSIYPDTFPKDFDIDYNAETKVLLVEYGLPSPDQLPTLLEVKYIATKKELKEIHLSETQLFKIYDITIYNITLRTLHELFEADQSNSIDAIIFNGWVNASNKATGKIVNNCIVSIQVSKPEFIEIELSNIDPKACFKSLKGIGSSKLSGIIAVQPIAQINRNDRRFVIAQDVAEQLNEGSNLAAMDWQDFEHLIREIFEKEFSTNGGEVKVTQASRDGGVDAIAFDPDPIRGGKIVIQAKRYTNTVGVAAVRDLYGTVVNEGATKGILVTTTDYGPDAYDFAKNKPLTLMNGANLLYLLDKHGHKARIDIAEAKRLQM
jgi:restriction system protein